MSTTERDGPGGVWYREADYLAVCAERDRLARVVEAVKKGHIWEDPESDPPWGVFAPDGPIMTFATFDEAVAAYLDSPARNDKS